MRIFRIGRSSRLVTFPALLSDEASPPPVSKGPFAGNASVSARVVVQAIRSSAQYDLRQRAGRVDGDPFERSAIAGAEVRAVAGDKHIAIQADRR